MQSPLPSSELEQLDAVETDILNVLLHDFGYDYAGASAGWLKRVIRGHVAVEHLSTTRGLREKVLHDQACRVRLLRRLTSAPRALFQEPGFWRSFRETVVPWLRTYPFIRVWHVGCATGEEVYSMAILLEEAGLYDRCRIYTTDPDEMLLKQAKDGIVPLTNMQAYTRNYQEAGGEHAFSRYYSANYDQAVFGAHLKRNVVFAQHDLETDGPFNEFHVIICRDLLTALTPDTQERARGLFLDSLVHLGFLCLGTKEPVEAVTATGEYEVNGESAGIFRRRR